MVKDRESMKGVESDRAIALGRDGFARPVILDAPRKGAFHLIGGGMRLGRMGRIGRVGTPNTVWAQRYNVISNSVPNLQSVPLYTLGSES